MAWAWGWGSLRRTHTTRTTSWCPHAPVPLSVILLYPPLCVQRDLDTLLDEILAPDVQDPPKTRTPAEQICFLLAETQFSVPELRSIYEQLLLTGKKHGLKRREKKTQSKKSSLKLRRIEFTALHRDLLAWISQNPGKRIRVEAPRDWVRQEVHGSLRYWGLVRRVSPGRYRVTDLGRRWLAGQARISRWVEVQGDKVDDYGDEDLSILEVTR